MKILMVMNGHGIGGAELQFIELANQLSLRHEVILVCLQGRGAIQAGDIRAEITVHEFLYSTGPKGIKKILDAIAFCRSNSSNVCVTTSFAGDLVARLAGVGTEKLLVTLQTVSEFRRYGMLKRQILKGFEKLIAGCKDIEVFLINEGQAAEKIEIVNNWVDFTAREITETRLETRHRMGLAEKDFVIGCIGRMHHQKGQEFLIRAFNKISVVHPNSKLVLVGDGPKMSYMREVAAGNPSILFTGTLAGSEYTNALNSFDVYVQPSRYEGMPRTLLDAMYLGLPVIATSVNGNVDAIDHGENGLLVPPEDVHGIEEKLNSLFVNKEFSQNLGFNASRDAKKHFSMTSQTAHIEKILLKVVNQT